MMDLVPILGPTEEPKVEKMDFEELIKSLGDGSVDVGLSVSRSLALSRVAPL